MNAALDVDRLARVCGMFGSDHTGERASAALKAHNLVHGAGLTWLDVLVCAKLRQPDAVLPSAAWRRELTPATILSLYGAGLTGWEKCFLAGLAKCTPATWTTRQREVLADIQRRFQ